MSTDGIGRLADPPSTHAELTVALAATETAWAQARTLMEDAHLEYAATVRAYVEAVRAEDRAGKEWALGRVTAARARYHQAVHHAVEAELTHRETVARYEAERRQAQ
ncbi:MAG TPA: hypothetical protein VK467_09590 [Gemmatimonadales bacterium]|nr:hypothetical protein [Gemmatimonadales bacterium]